MLNMMCGTSIETLLNNCFVKFGGYKINLSDSHGVVLDYEVFPCCFIMTFFKLLNKIFCKM